MLYLLLHDLFIKFGIPEQYDHPTFDKAVKQIIHTSRTKGLSVGIHFSLEPERQIKWIQEGVDIVIHSSDIALFSQKLNNDINIIKKAVGDTEDGGTKDITPVI